jgi:hypothetical protein
MGDITISGGGTTMVATGELFENAACLRRLILLIDECQSQVDPRPKSWLGERDCLPAESARYLLDAHSALERSRELSDRLVISLERSAERYGFAERTVRELGESAGAAIGWAIGPFLPAFAMLVVASAFAVAAPGLALATIVTGSPGATLEAVAKSSFVSDNQIILSNPLFVEAVRALVSSIDNAILGFAGLPAPVATALDDRALGWFGLQGATGLVIAAAGPTLLTETPVSVRMSRTAVAKPITGFADLASRIPSGAGSAQIRIEKYETAGSAPRWVVYAGGTVDASAVPGREPWDSTSNLHGIAGGDPGSVRATLQAMQEAGIQPGDPVLSVGYSQGGIVATEVVRRGGFSNAGLVTFGSPTGQLSVDATIPNVAVEISEDLVPALGGQPRSAAQGGLDRLLVRRRIYDGIDPPTNELLPAHAIRNYRETAELMDRSSDPRLTEMREQIAEITGGNSASVTLWHAQRD